MRILMIAPEPFFEPRGTPFSEYHRIRALLELGHTVDLVTYPFGQDVTMPGLRVFRCLRPPLVRHVKIGPSLAKVPLDLAAGADCAPARAGRPLRRDPLARGGRGIGIVLAGALGIPHVYDMHSSLPQQLSNFAYSRSRVLRVDLRPLRARRHPALEGRDRDLPGAEAHRAGIEPRGAPS